MSAAANAITNPIATAITVSSRCWSRCGWRMSPQWAVTQSQQNRPFCAMQPCLPPGGPPKSGMTTGGWGGGAASSRPFT